MNTYKDKWQEVPSSLNKPMDVLDLGPPYFFKQTTCTLFSGFVSAYAFFGIVFGRDFLKMHVFKCLVSQTIDHRAI